MLLTQSLVVNIKGKKSHEIVSQALEILVNLDHRGACGCEPNTGDGAGILLQMPDSFLRSVCAPLGIVLPEPYHYGVGMLFTSPKATERNAARHILEKILVDEGVELLGWRNVPTDNSSLGNTAWEGEPMVRQLFLKRPLDCVDEQAFNRKLYIINQRATNEIRTRKSTPCWTRQTPRQPVSLPMPSIRWSLKNWRFLWHKRKGKKPKNF